MQITAKTWNEYITRLSRLNQKAGQLMRQYIDTHGTGDADALITYCLLYTSPSPRDGLLSRMPSSA